MTTGLVFTVSANRDEEQHSPPSTAKTAITWTANENRQLFINPKCNLTNYVREASTEYGIKNSQPATRRPQPELCLLVSLSVPSRGLRFLRPLASYMMRRVLGGSRGTRRRSRWAR